MKEKKIRVLRKETSQIKDVLNYLEKGNTLTQKEAYALFGTQRLGGIICELRKMNYDIETKIESVPTKYGTNSNIAIYSMRRE